VADVLFVGVTTGASLVHRAMPLWRALLPSDCVVRGVDIALDAPDEAYIDLLDGLRRSDAAGAVVTAHKLRVFRAARAQFAHLDAVSLACEEVNAIRHRGSTLRGYARDPISVGRVVDRIWPQREGEVVCLGAGGTAMALAHHLRTTAAPIRFVCAERDPGALAQLARLAGGAVVGHLGAGPWDALVEAASPRSLIVNATGLGKDRPGSPISAVAVFPRGAVVWELNYRGELDFLGRARLQAEAAELRVHDGWTLFCHGWAAALAAVLDMPDDAGLGDRFAEAAAELRPGSANRSTLGSDRPEVERWTQR
jgi:shikimate 5-dehydrogenase